MIDPFAKLTGAQTAGTPPFKTADFGLQRRIEFAALLRESEAAAPAPAKSSAGASTLLAASNAVSPARDLPVQASSVASLDLPSRARGNTPTPPVPPAPAPTTPTPVPSSVEGLGFVPSDALDGPIRYQQVPDFAKAPLGPYVQAPAEYGGEWWQVNPFNWQPWLILDEPATPVEPPPLPEGFEQLFGPRPEIEDFGRNYWTHQIALVEWEESLKYFKGIGIPEGLDELRLAQVTEDFIEWGLGEPVFYEGRNGWRARFPDSQNPDYEPKPIPLLMAPHVNIAFYQVGMIKRGIMPATIHPFIPPTVFDLYGSEAAV